MDLSVRSYLNAGIAFTAASTIALTPLVAPPGAHQQLALPHVSASQIHLAAAINPADIAALVANLNAAMSSVTSTVTSVVDASGNTLTGALNTAAGLNNNLWDGLISAARGNPTLASVLIALKAASAGGLSELAQSIDAAGGTITTTGQVAALLTSTITGSLGTAAQAVASVVNDPLSAASYLGLLTTPIGIVGLAINGGINVGATLATNGVQLTSTLVHGVSDQIGNALSLVNGLLDAGKTLTDVALIDGTLTAVQGIVSAPVTAALAAVTGLTSAAANAATFTLGRVAGGATSITTTWLGNGSTPGAFQNAIATIGAAPLSPASYTTAISILVGAASTTARTIVGTASSFASLPFRVAADLTGTAADVFNSFTGGLATVASGLLQAAGLPPFISALPHVMATAVTTAVNIAAFTTKATLNTIATAIDLGQAIGGIFNSANTAPQALTTFAAGPAALPNAERHTTLVNVATIEGDGEVKETHDSAAPQVPTTKPDDSPAASETATSPTQSVTEPTNDLEPTASEPKPDTAPGTPSATEASEPTATVLPVKSSTEKHDPDTTSTPTTRTTGGGTADEESTTSSATKAAHAGGQPRTDPSGGTTRPATPKHADNATNTDQPKTDTYGKHASGTTASHSSTAAGRHRKDSTPSATNATSGGSNGTTSASPSSDRSAGLAA